MSIWARHEENDYGLRPVELLMVCDGCGKQVPLPNWERNGPEIECIYVNPDAHPRGQCLVDKDLCGECAAPILEIEDAAPPSFRRR